MNDETGAWSTSTLSVRETLRDAADSDDSVVVTVTDAEGSAYRRPGAKRVLDDAVAADATAARSDGPVADLAERALADGPLRETLDLTAADSGGFGLGYNGVVDVLAEPADGSLRAVLDRVAAGNRVALLTVVGSERPDAGGERPAAGGQRPDADRDGIAPVGARAVVDEDGAVAAADPRPRPPDDLLAAVRERAGEFAAAGRSDTVTVETDAGTAAVFVDGLEPVPDLLVFGRDEDVRPVARFAREVGFRVTVATAPGRGGRPDPERFPAAHEVVAVRPSEVGDAVARPADTYAVVMSHDFADDRLALEALLETAVPYVGLMGPRKRFEQMCDALADEGVELDAADRDRIASPVGLDLGGDDPAQVALSVVGEALAASNGREGGRLTDGEGPIHPRSGSDSP